VLTRVGLRSTSRMKLKIDHVTIAGSRLEPLQQAFADAGLTTDYGGPHSNNITHMSLLGFDDGSYIELISTLAPGQHSPWWHEHIVGDGGPCAWALEVDNVATEVQRVSALGVAVDGPHHYSRQRPDGTLIEWDLAVLGDQGMGALLPFIIKDRTPRHYRVSPSASVVNSELTGVATVVLGVRELEQAVALFRKVYNLPSPEYQESPDFGTVLARFGAQPLTLAAPLGSQGWLSARLARFGETPCAYLLGTRDIRKSAERFRLCKTKAWFSQDVAWFDSGALTALRLGVVSS
ncbi:MAG: VOC family protein, partial [Acidiferrobacterales bacterium]